MSNIVKFDIKQAPHAFDEVLELQIGSWAVPAGEITVEQYLKDCVAAVSDLKIADVNDKEGYEIVSRARKDLAWAEEEGASLTLKTLRMMSDEEYQKFYESASAHWNDLEAARIARERRRKSARLSWIALPRSKKKLLQPVRA